MLDELINESYPFFEAPEMGFYVASLCLCPGEETMDGPRDSYLEFSCLKKIKE